MHRYLIRIENSKNLKPEQSLVVLIELRRKAEEFGTVIKNLRVTDLAFEFDLYSNDEGSKRKTIDDLTGEYGKFLNERDLAEDGLNPSQYQSKADTVKLALDLFNQQRYWECHETLEQIWRRQEKGTEKDVQQGIILAASALVHYQKNEDSVCLGMIPRAMEKLSGWSEEFYYSFNVEKLKGTLEEMQRSRTIWNPRI